MFQIAHASRSSKRNPIRFDESPEFHRHYVVAGEDETAVREIVGGRLIEYLQQHGEDAWAVEADGEWLGVARRPAFSMKRHVAPEDMWRFRDDVLRIHTLVSSH